MLVALQHLKQLWQAFLWNVEIKIRVKIEYILMGKASAILLSDISTQDLFEIEAGEKMTISN
jgi:hypothetical protein